MMRAAVGVLALAAYVIFPGCSGDGSAEVSVDSQSTMDAARSASDVGKMADGADAQVLCGAAREGVGKPWEWSATLTVEGFTVLDVPTRLTDPDISLHVKDKNGNETLHRVYAPTKGIDKLVVFFPGTGAEPQQYGLLLAAAAELGYHVVGLVYANQLSVSGACKSSTDECACLGNMRLEILTGTDTSDEVEVGLPDGVDNRLPKLLQYLAAETPAAGWDQFLDADGAVVWQHVLLSGHAQGGGHVALLAQRYEVARAVFFSSPADTCTRAGVNSLPDWAQWARKTPSDRLFGLSHLKEEGRDNHQLHWDNLDMAGGGCLVHVDRSYPPFDDAQILVTDIDPASGRCPEKGLCEAAHGATIGDTPLDAANKPVLLSVWQYLFALQ